MALKLAAKKMNRIVYRQNDVSNLFQSLDCSAGYIHPVDSIYSGKKKIQNQKLIVGLRLVPVESCLLFSLGFPRVSGLAEVSSERG